MSGRRLGAGVLLTASALAACRLVDGGESSEAAATADTLRASAEQLLEPAGDDQTSPARRVAVASATDGQVTMLVWSEELATASGGERFLRMARVDAGGKVLDRPARALARGAGATAVARGATEYLIAYAGRQGIDAMRVSGDGEVLGTTTLVTMSSEDLALADVSVAWNGTSYLVAWSESVDGGRAAIRAMRVGADGTRIDTQALAAGSIDVGRLEPATVQVASRGGAWLVAWSSEVRAEMGAVGISADGRVAPDASVLAKGRAITLASDGREYLAMYQADREIVTLRLGDDGAPLAAPRRVFELSDDGYAQMALTPHAGAWRATWTSAIAKTTWAAPLGRDGSIAEAAKIVLSGRASLGAVSIACATERCWGTVHDGTLGVVSLLDQGARAIPVAFGASQPETPAVAASREGWTVAWVESTFDARRPDVRRQILGARLGPDGTASATTRLSTDDDLDPRWVAIASGAGGESVIAYADGSTSGDCRTSIRARRLGGRERSAALVIADGARCLRAPRVEADGAGFVVVWQGEGVDGGVHARRIRPDGTMDEASTSAPQAVGQLQLLRGGSSLLAVWTKCDGGDPSACAKSDVVTSLLVDGKLATPEGKVALPDAALGDERFSVTFRDGHYLISDARPTASRPARAIRVAESGDVVGEPFPIGKLPLARRIFDGHSLIELGRREDKLHALQLGPSGRAAEVTLRAIAPAAPSSAFDFGAATDLEGNTLVAFPRYVASAAGSDAPPAIRIGVQVLSSEAIEDPADAPQPAPLPEDPGAPADPKMPAADAGAPDAETPPSDVPAAEEPKADAGSGYEPLAPELYGDWEPEGAGEEPGSMQDAGAAKKRKKASRSSCSAHASGTGGASSAGLVGLGLAIALLGRRRRRI